MATINGMRHWPLGTPAKLTESLDLLSRNTQTPSMKYDYRIKVYTIIFDSDHLRFGLLAVKKDDGKYFCPSQMLEKTDTDIHSCIVRICLEVLNATPHVICGHLPIRRLMRLTKGIDYVVFCEDTHSIKQLAGPDLIFVDQSDTAKALDETQWPPFEYHKVIGLFWNGLKAEIATLAEVIRVAEIRHETEVISGAQAAKQRLLDMETMITAQISAEVQAKLLANDDDGDGDNDDDGTSEFSPR